MFLLGRANTDRPNPERFDVPGPTTNPNLADATVGTTVVVHGLDTTGDGAGERLEHMGFIPGTVVRVERRAPLGDPTVYELRGYRLALRRESAAMIHVDAHASVDGIAAVDVDDSAVPTQRTRRALRAMASMRGGRRP